MVGDDGGHLHRQLADALAIEQVDQTVIELGDEDHHLARDGPVADAQVHVEALDDLGEALDQLLDRQAADLEHHPHEEAIRQVIVELLCLGDVGAHLEEVHRHRGDDAGTVAAGEGENVGTDGHGMLRTSAGSALGARCD